MDFSRIWLFYLSLSTVCLEICKSTPIVGGRLVSTKAGFKPQYQFIVSLLDVTFDKNVEHFCGGSLLNHRWILTAAHCLWRKDFEAVVALVGHENISNTSAIDDFYELDRVEFQDFQPISYQNDIALARLHKDFVAKDIEFKTALLPDIGMKPNRNDPCTIIGYGAIGHSGIISKHLLEANVYVITNRVCREKLGHVWAPKKHDNAVCAVGERQDACQGDSGGPLICQYEGQEYVYGLVSHGIACGGKGIPSVYTVTLPYLKWIKTIIAE